MYLSRNQKISVQDSMRAFGALSGAFKFDSWAVWIGCLRQAVQNHVYVPQALLPQKFAGLQDNSMKGSLPFFFAWLSLGR